MRRLSLLALLLVLTMLPVAGFSTSSDTVTLTKSEYERLARFEELAQIFDTVDRYFLFEYDHDALLEGAAQGLLGALDDPYTYHYNPQGVENTILHNEGTYGGIGVVLYPNPTDDRITIEKVYRGSPAQEAGIQWNDCIIAVEGEPMAAADLSKAVSIMRGTPGTDVVVTIKRDTEIFDVTLTRAVIVIEVMEYEILDNNIGYLCLYEFDGVLMTQVYQAIAEFQAANVQGLILDMRGNPGGLVEYALDIADIFLDDVVIMGARDRYDRENKLYADAGAWDVPVVILMNGGSASASEILAAALHTNGATIVGTKSFGKGVYQTVLSLGHGETAMQLTTHYWLTPEGITIHGEGIAPDIEVELAEDAIDARYQIIRELDNQLAAAVEILLKK